MINKAIDRLSEQQRGLGEDNKVYWVAEQIKDICRESEAIAELVYQDLANEQMSVKAVEKKIEAYAKKHGGCTPPQAADKIIREFYGLSPKGESPATAPAPNLIDINDFI